MQQNLEGRLLQPGALSQVHFCCRSPAPFQLRLYDFSNTASSSVFGKSLSHLSYLCLFVLCVLWTAFRVLNCWMCWPVFCLMCASKQENFSKIPKAKPQLSLFLPCTSDSTEKIISLYSYALLLVAFKLIIFCLQNPQMLFACHGFCMPWQL